MSRRVRVQPSAATARPGDSARIVDLDDVDSATQRVDILVGAIRDDPDGARLVEVVVDGWRFELEVEDAARAELRRRATRAPDAATASGPTEIRAIIPGRVAAVHVAAGDTVEAGRSLLVVEAMKMQNEIRAPRPGTVKRVAVAAGETIDLGDLLVVVT